MYKQSQIFEGVSRGIIRTTDNVWIPLDPANTDYQEYLRWLEAGNTPEPADEQGGQ